MDQKGSQITVGYGEWIGGKVVMLFVTISLCVVGKRYGEFTGSTW